MTQTGMLFDQTELVLFDLDGTLLDTAPDLVNALFRVCDEQTQTKPDFALACRYVSTGAIGLVRLAFPELNDDELEPLRQRLVDVYAEELCVATKYFAGIESLLKTLEDQNKAWGIVTNKPAGLTDPLLEQLNITRRCAAVVSGDTLPQRKPDPAPLLHALDLAGHAPETAIYVGDAPQDVAAGNAAGMTTIAVGWGYILPGQDHTSWGADYTIEHPDELPAL